MPTTFEPINVLAGVEPSTDMPEATTQHYTFTKSIRFVDGFPEKIGGWDSLDFDNQNAIEGFARSVFGYVLSGFNRYLIGTNSDLYNLLGTNLTNITPVKTATIAIANSLDTYYDTLASDPIATTSGSNAIIITDASHKFTAGDSVTLSGSSDVNGILAAEINTSHFIRETTTNTYTVNVSSNASNSGSSGGALVVRSSGYITVNATAHDLNNGQRVKIAGAADTGGITAAQINLEFIIRNVSTNTFDIYTAGTATSSVSSGGGASTTYQEPIDAGSIDTINGFGYGAGLYGIGLYGVSKTSATTTPARIWSHDVFGDLTVSCYNNDSDIYSWNGDTTVAPAKISNSPTANFVFVSDSIVVALGAAGVDNRIQWCDQGGITNWTTGQSGEDDIEGAGKFISQARARGENLLFTSTQTYTFRYIGGKLIWATKLLDGSIGIIAPNAVVAANGVIYFMGNDNFYMWRGGNLEVIPSNSSTQCTALRYVFDNLNYSQKDKCFAWFNRKFNEVWFHYPDEASDEPNKIARVNLYDYTWSIDEISRTAGEKPTPMQQTPYLLNEDMLYLHENGNDNVDTALDFQLDSNFIYGGTDTVQITSFIPDNLMTGSINVNIKTKQYPNDVVIQNKNYTVTGSSGRISTEQNGRYWKFSTTGSDLGQYIQFGRWQQEIKSSTPK